MFLFVYVFIYIYLLTSDQQNQDCAQLESKRNGSLRVTRIARSLAQAPKGDPKATLGNLELRAILVARSRLLRTGNNFETQQTVSFLHIEHNYSFPNFLSLALSLSLYIYMYIYKYICVHIHIYMYIYI